LIRGQCRKRSGQGPQKCTATVKRVHRLNVLLSQLQPQPPPAAPAPPVDASLLV
jgi:hypothetical protein